MVETFVQSTDDVVKFLKDQHNLIKDMFDEVLSALRTPRPARRRSSNCANCWPCTRPPRRWWSTRGSATRSTNGDEIVDARLKEEHKAKEKLSKLEGMDIDSQEFIAELTKFRDAVDRARRARGERGVHQARTQAHGGRPRPDGQGGAGRGGDRAHPPAPGCGVAPRRTSAVGPFASMLDRARDAIAAAVR